MTEPKEEKCEACCGSGYINFWTDDGHISMRTCRRCDGYGYINVTDNTIYMKLRYMSRLADDTVAYSDWTEVFTVVCLPDGAF